MFPSIIISTVECDCDDIAYKIRIHIDENSMQEVQIPASDLIPVVGRMVELLNAHRRELKKDINGESNTANYSTSNS